LLPARSTLRTLKVCSSSLKPVRCFGLEHALKPRRQVAFVAGHALPLGSEPLKVKSIVVLWVCAAEGISPSILVSAVGYPRPGIAAGSGLRYWRYRWPHQKV